MVIKDSAKLEERIGYRFKDRYLLECALTHTSYANEQRIRKFEDYERLEFLGDAVLEMISSAFLYEKYPRMREGDLSKLRASLVCEPALAFCAREINLPDYIRLGRGEEGCGGREKDSIIADITEAIIGAMDLDSGGIEEPKRFIHRFVLADHEGMLLFVDAKSILLERSQKVGKTLHYEIVDESGPEHLPVFTAAVMDGETEIARGTGRSKKAAEQQAAYKVLKEEPKWLGAAGK